MKSIDIFFFLNYGEYLLKKIIKCVKLDFTVHSVKY